MAKQLIYHIIYELMMILMTPPPSRPEPAQIDAIKTLDLAKTYSHALIRVPGSYPIDLELVNIAQESAHPTAKGTPDDEGPNQKRHRAASISQHVKKQRTEKPLRHLLDLPGETRMKIWTEAIGGRHLHIFEGSSELRMTHDICTAPGFARKDDHHSIASSDLSAIYHKPTKSTLFDHDHSYCPKRREINSRDPKIDLILLRLCKQTYTEGSYILWSTNTFCFRSTKDIEKFCKPPKPRRKLMQNMFIPCCLDSITDYSRLFPNLHGLKEVHFSVRLEFDKDLKVVPSQLLTDDEYQELLPLLQSTSPKITIVVNDGIQHHRVVLDGPRTHRLTSSDFGDEGSEYRADR
ncbi:MAG: hypothetical protein Q9187_002649 [Circinaria calcarea]